MAGDSNPLTSKSLTERLDIDFALQTAGLGIWEVDPITNTVNWDDRCRALFGLAKENRLPYEQAIQYIHPDDVERVNQAVQRAINPNSSGFYDETYRTLGADDGLLRWVRFTGRGYFNQDGQIERFAGVAQEVTDKVMAHQSQQQLVEREARFRSLIEEAPVATCLFVGEELRIEVANEAMITVWGKGPGVIGMPLTDALPELRNQHFPTTIKALLTTGNTLSVKAGRADLIIEGQLQTFYFDYEFKPLRTPNGTVYAIMETAIDVTAQQQLLASENRFRSIVEQAPMAIGLLSGRDMVIEVGNDKIFEVWGKDKAIMGLPIREALPELKGQVFTSLLEGVYDTGEPIFGTGALANLVRNGQLEEVYFDFVYTPLRNTDEQINGVMVLATEVTQQVLARQRIEASEAKLRAVIAGAPAGMGLFVGRDLVVDLPNQTFIDIVGKGPDIVGKPLREVMPELLTENQPFLAILDEVYTSGTMFQSVGSPVDIVRQGVMTRNYYNITYTPLRDERGAVFAILDIAIDVTEAVVAQQQLKASEAFARNLLYSSPVANLVLLGEDMLIQSINEGMLAMLGRDASIIGKPFMEAMPELKPTPLLSRLQHVLATGESFHQPEERIELVRYGQSYTGYFHYIYTALRDASDQPTGVVVTAIEVTPQVLSRQRVEVSEARYKNLSQELEQQVQQRTQELATANEELAANNKELESSNEEYAAINEELEEANSLLMRSNDNLQTFAYVASHDLQEPLRKIQQFGDLLRQQYGPPLGGGLDYLERMQVAARRMSTLIKDLLSFSRISTQRDSSGPVALGPVVQTVLTDLELILDETDARVEVDDLPTIDGDSSQLGQLFQNLISNALKFRQEGVAPHVQIRSRRLAPDHLPPGVKPTRRSIAYCRIDVIDNGVGFDEKYLDRIFQVFQRLYPQSQYAGTGIGLAICEKVVANHGGAITASSSPGQGATFSVYLPV